LNDVAWIALLNPDAVPEPNWLEELTRATGANCGRYGEAGRHGRYLSRVRSSLEAPSRPESRGYGSKSRGSVCSLCCSGVVSERCTSKGRWV
jgi:hypothetical protein